MSEKQKSVLGKAWIALAAVIIVTGVMLLMDTFDRPTNHERMNNAVPGATQESPAQDDSIGREAGPYR